MAMEDIGIRLLVLGLGEFRRAVGTARDDMSSLERTIRSTSGSTEKFGASLTRIGGAMVGLGRTMTLAITGPLAIITGSLINAGAQFEDTFAGVAKTVDGVAIGFDEIALAAKTQLGTTITTMDEAKVAADKLGMSFGDLTPIGQQVRDDFRDLALAIPISSMELNKLGEIIGALGVKAEDIADVTKIVAELGVATDISAEEAAKGLVKIFNIIGKEGDSLVEFLKSAGSAIVALGNNSVSSEGEILALSTRLAAAGDRANFSAQELLAWATTISDVGSRAEAGGTAVSRALNEMLLAVQTGSENLATFAQVSGMSADEFSRAFEEDASGALLNFIGNLNKGIKAGTITKDMLNDMGLGGIRALDVLGRLSEATGLFGKNMEISNQAWEEQIALEEEAEKRFSTVTSQVQILKNTFTDLGITIFDLVKDDITSFIDGIRSVVKWFKELDPGIQKAILKFALIAAAIGPLLVLLGGAVQIIGTLTTVFAALASPVGLAALAIGGIGLALGTLIGWDNVLNGLRDAAAGVAGKFQAVLDIISDISANKITLEQVGQALLGQELAAPVAKQTNSMMGAEDRKDVAAANASDQAPISNLKENIAALAIPPEFLQSLQQMWDMISGIGRDFSEGFMKGLEPFLAGAGQQFATIMSNLQPTLERLGPLFDELGITMGKIDWAGLGNIIGTVLGLALAMVLDLLNIFVKDVIPFVIDGVTHMITVFGDWIQIISDLLQGKDLTESFTKLWNDILEGMRVGLTHIVEGVGGYIVSLINQFWRLYNVLVGHSIIPDLMTEIFGAFSGMKDSVLKVLDDLLKGASEIFSSLFGGGGGETPAATGFSVEISPEMMAATQTAIMTIQTAFTTAFTVVNDAFNLMMLGIQTAFTNFPTWVQTALDVIVFAFGGLVSSIIVQLAELQLAAVAAFTNMGSTASNAFSAQITSSMSSTIATMIELLLMLDLYFLDTVKHMYGHWLDFVAGADALSSMWADHTIAIFDRIHNEGVGKIHKIRDAWKDASAAMEGQSSDLGDSVNTVAGAFAKVAGAAAGAASAVWAAANKMIAAMEAVQSAATGSPELKIHHSFERFEKYLKGTDFGHMIDTQMTMPAFMTQVNPMMPATAGGNTTNIDRSLKTGDIVGSSLETQDDVVDTMTRVIRMSGAVGG